MLLGGFKIQGLVHDPNGAFMARKVGDLHSFYMREYTREEAESKEKALFFTRYTKEVDCIGEAPTRRSESGCKGTHSKTTAEDAGFNDGSTMPKVREDVMQLV